MTLSFWRTFSGSAALLVLCAACDKDPDTIPQGDARGDAGAGGVIGDAGSEPVVCEEGPSPHSTPKPTKVGVVSGNLVDEDGKPTDAGIVQVCGIDICKPADVAADGKFLKDGFGESLDTPAFKFGDGFSWAKLSIPLPGGDTDLGQLVVTRLPDLADGVPLTAGKTATSGGVTLSLAEGSGVNFVSIDYPTPEEQVFRAARLSDAALSQLKQDFVVAYGLAPLATKLCPVPRISLENSSGLEAGTALELYMLGLEADEKFSPYARWAKVSEGQVTEDGARLEFEQGVPLLSAIAVRVKE